MGDVGVELEQMDKAPTDAPPAGRDDKGRFTKPPDKPKDKAQDKPPKPEDKPADKPEDKPLDKPEDKPGDKPAEKPVAPVKASDLRTAFEGLKKKVREEYEPELQKLRVKVADMESKGAGDSAALMEKIKGLEKEKETLQKEIAFFDETRDPEFIKTAVEPYQKAWENAVSTFRELRVRVQEGEDDLGEPKFTYRAANEDDLWKLATMSLAEMDIAAQEMFGPSAPRALLQVENLKQLSDKHKQALETTRKNIDQLRAERKAKREQQNKAVAQSWMEANKALEEKFPTAYNPKEGDAEDSAAHLRGFALADLMFGGTKILKPEQIEALPKAFQEAAKSKQPLNPILRSRLAALA